MLLIYWYKMPKAFSEQDLQIHLTLTMKLTNYEVHFFISKGRECFIFGLGVITNIFPLIVSYGLKCGKGHRSRLGSLTAPVWLSNTSTSALASHSEGTEPSYTHTHTNTHLRAPLHPLNQSHTPTPLPPPPSLIQFGLPSNCITLCHNWMVAGGLSMPVNLPLSLSPSFSLPLPLFLSSSLTHPHMHTHPLSVSRSVARWLYHASLPCLAIIGWRHGCCGVRPELALLRSTNNMHVCVWLCVCVCLFSSGGPTEGRLGALANYRRRVWNGRLSGTCGPHSYPIYTHTHKHAGWECSISPASLGDKLPSGFAIIYWKYWSHIQNVESVQWMGVFTHADSLEAISHIHTVAPEDFGTL